VLLVTKSIRQEHTLNNRSILIDASKQAELHTLNNRDILIDASKQAELNQRESNLHGNTESEIKDNQSKGKTGVIVLINKEIIN